MYAYAFVSLDLVSCSFIFFWDHTLQCPGLILCFALFAGLRELDGMTGLEISLDACKTSTLYASLFLQSLELSFFPTSSSKFHITHEENFLTFPESFSYFCIVYLHVFQMSIALYIFYSHLCSFVLVSPNYTKHIVFYTYTLCINWYLNLMQIYKVNWHFCKPIVASMFLNSIQKKKKI